MKQTNRNISFSGLFLALALLLPFMTGQIPAIGNMLLPMHLPVLICGLVCGWQYGLIVGFIAPPMRAVLFGMPPMFPIAVSMAFELATYGLVIGLLYKLFPKKPQFTVLALLVSMVCGRFVWGLARLLMSGIAGQAFGFEMFIGGAFMTAIPGIISQLVLVPLIVIALQKVGYLKTR